MRWIRTFWTAFTEHPWAGAILVFLTVIGLVAVGTTLARFLGLG